MQPADLVRLTFDAVEAGDYEVIADELTAGVKAALSAPVLSLYPELLAPGPAASQVSVQETGK